MSDARSNSKLFGGINNDELTKVAQVLVDEVSKIVIESVPVLKWALSEITEIIFVPRAVIRQLLLSIALETAAITLSQLLQIMRTLGSNFSTRSRLIRQLQKKQTVAETQDEWMDMAEQIDAMQGGDIWRSDPSCALYESDRISARIDELISLMRRNDIFELMFNLRGGIGRNKFGLLHEGLFSKALAGSKVLVETYHNVVCAALDFIADASVLPPEEPIPTDKRLAFFNETRHSYGRTAMILSGGAALGFYHVGVVKTLMENALMPRVIAGSSAGSIVCAMIGTRTNDECMTDLFNVKGTHSMGHSGQLRFDHFRPVGYHQNKNAKANEPQSGNKQIRDAKRLWQIFSPIGLRKFTSCVYDILAGHTRAKDIMMSDTEHLIHCCKANIGTFTFQEAFDRTGRILNITVSPQNRSDPPRLLNYLTAPHVMVWSAAVASSSLPGVFEANKLLVRDSDGTERAESGSSGLLQDGSMEADLPMEQLSEMFNVNHFIISQANPHAIMFSSLSLSKSIWHHPVISFANGILLFVKSQVKAWFKNLVTFIGGRRVSPIWDTRRGFFLQFFTQEYEGRDCDITLNPWAGDLSLFKSFIRCIYNPSQDEFAHWIKAAERETWRYIPAIKSHIAEEMTLDRCVQKLRRKIRSESHDIHMKNGIVQQSDQEKLGKGFPSFFQSPSLVNMGGFAITDNYQNDKVKAHHHNEHDSTAVQFNSHQHLVFNVGWGGMGLRGNHSAAFLPLVKSTSAGSGLFFMDDDLSVADELSSADEATGATDNVPELRTTDSFKKSSATDLKGSYIKTTNMAHFYYRRNISQENMADVLQSDSNISQENITDVLQPDSNISKCNVSDNNSAQINGKC